jgi:hypothetical protein
MKHKTVYLIHYLKEKFCVIFRHAVSIAKAQFAPVCLQEVVTASTPLITPALASWVSMVMTAPSSILVTALSHLARMEAYAKGRHSFKMLMNAHL